MAINEFGPERPAIAYDPRDTSQDVSDRKTWKPTKNPALLMGAVLEWRLGQDALDWSAIARLADLAEYPLSHVSETESK